MPNYIYSNPSNPSETVEVFQSMKDEHVYIKDGIKWNREWTKPLASVDSKIDPNSPKDFLRYTESHRGTLGNTWDLAAELSDKRAGTTGLDEIKERSYRDYSKRRKGIEHPDIKKRKAREKLKKVGIEITD